MAQRKIYMRRKCFISHRRDDEESFDTSSTDVRPQLRRPHPSGGVDADVASDVEESNNDYSKQCIS
ncbi:MAG TPA: hypothetical protein VF635_08500, partial [Propionibacteriaceae bacterium]